MSDLTDIIAPRPVVTQIAAPQPEAEPRTVRDVLLERQQREAQEVSRDTLRLDGRPVTGVRAQ